MPATYYITNALIDHIIRGPSTSSPGAAYSRPNQTFIGLYTAAPSPSGGGTEVSTSGTGYGRQAANFNAPASGSAASTGDIVYSAALTSWGTVTHYGIFDASTGGNLLFYAALGTSRAVLTGDQVRFPSGQLTVTGS